jgi:malate permease and related proteins
MGDLLLIPICIITGMLLVRIRTFPEYSYKVVNSIIIFVTLPALTLYYIPQIEIRNELILPAVVIWITFLLSIIFFVLLEKIFKWDKKTTGALILTGGLANTSFVGFPVLIALFGEEGLKIGVIIDQAGSFLVLSTLGVIVASSYSSGIYSAKKILVDILKYPPFYAFVISLIMIAAGIKHNELSSTILSKLGNPTIVLALISVGMQLKPKVDSLLWKELTTGLIYKLLGAPAIIFVIGLFIFKANGLIFNVSVIETAMPPMVMGSVLAVQFNLNPKLANFMVGIGIPISAATLALWWWVIR